MRLHWAAILSKNHAFHTSNWKIAIIKRITIKPAEIPAGNRCDCQHHALPHHTLTVVHIIDFLEDFGITVHRIVKLWARESSWKTATFIRGSEVATRTIAISTDSGTPSAAVYSCHLLLLFAKWRWHIERIASVSLQTDYVHIYEQNVRKFPGHKRPRLLGEARKTVKNE
jgi:hypothetical protein